MKTPACVPPLIYHSVVTSMQIRKQKETSLLHTSPSSASDASFPTCGESNYTSREKWNIAGRRKGPKLKRILLLGYRLSLLPFSFLTLCCPLWWEAGVNRGHIAATTPPSQCPSERKRLRVLPGGTPGLSQHQLHICSLVADTRMTLADLRMKTLIKNLSPPVAYSLLPTDCTWAINPLSTKWNFCLNEAIMSSSSQTAESNEDPDYSFHGLGCSEDR